MYKKKKEGAPPNPEYRTPSLLCADSDSEGRSTRGGRCSAKSYIFERPSEATFQDHLSSEIVFAIYLTNHVFFAE